MRSGIAGVPTFHVGEEVVLFLYGESELGLSSPVGLGQGKFEVVETKEGGKLALNSSNNRTLFRGMDTAKRTRLVAASGHTPERGIEPGALLDLAEELGR